MNEFDPLFEKNDSKKIIKSNGIDEFNDHINYQRKNNLILLIYIVVNLVFMFISSALLLIQYPDFQTISSEITTVQSPNMEVRYTDDADIPINYHFTASFANTTDYDFKKLKIELVLFDNQGKEINHYTFTESNISKEEMITLDETLDYDKDYDHLKLSFSPDFSRAEYIWLNFLQITTIALLILFVDWKSFVRDFKLFKKNFKKYSFYIVMGFILLMGAVILTNFIFQILGISETSQNEQIIKSMFVNNNLELTLLFFTLCIFTPIAEEAVFRKFLFYFFEKRLGVIIAIFSSGIIFGLMHVIMNGDFIQSIPYIIMGTIFGYIYFISKKNIIVTILLHFINNGYMYLIYFALAKGLISSF